MKQIDVLPPKIQQLFHEKGVSDSDMLLSLRSDINNDFIYTDVWVVCTKTNLYILSGNFTYSTKKRLGISFGKIREEFLEYDYQSYSLSSLSDFKCDNYISTGRLLAKSSENPNEDYISLFRFTNSKKNAVMRFIKYIGSIQEKGEIDESDDKEEEEYCPKCKNRYPDPKRKVCPKCMDKSKLVKRLGIFFAKYKLFIIITLVSLLAMTALSTLTPYISGRVFYDEVLTQNGKWYGQVLFVIGLMIATKLLRVFVEMINGIVSAKIAARVVYDLKKTIFSSIGRLSLSFFTNRQTGGLMTSVNNDANTIYWFFCDGFPYLLINTVQFIAITVIMVSINPILTLLTFLTVPLFLLVYRVVFMLFEKLYAKNFSRRRAFNAIISDVLSGVRVVKAFSKEKLEIERFEERSEELAVSSKQIGTANSALFPIIYFVLNFGNFIVWAYGGWQVIQGDFSLGLLMTFLGYMNMIQSPLNFFSEVSRWWAECLNAIQRVFEIMDAIPDVPETENPISLPSPRGEVEFKNVGFYYEKGRKILENISFKVNAGETIGIVGETGAGKSTIVNLLIRLYDVTEGQILIDGIDVKDLSFSDLHSSVAIVSQETYLFRGTIMENIRYAKPDATDEEIFLAAKIADAHSFIIKSPDGYETTVGWGNKELSGGERQRISIARAILRDPKILILDEATAAMDTETERKIQNAITRLSKGRTTIMIAHRLSTLRDADKLIVIENGKMPEFGTHSELIRQQGIYYNLYKLQTEALKTIGITE